MSVLFWFGTELFALGLGSLNEPGPMLFPVLALSVMLVIFLLDVSNNKDV